MTFTPLPQEFYDATADVVAPRLLGHWLVRNTPEGPCGGAIVEAEAYLRDDPACHASVGETARNRTMFGAHGRSYVYLIYGFYYCFNAVCLPPGHAEAVLVRAVEPVFGQDWMMKQRKVDDPLNLTSGPGKLCLAMDIDRALDGVDLCDATSPLFIAKNPTVELFRKERGPVITTTRIGITKAADLPLRYYLNGSPYISKRVAGAKLKLKSHIAVEKPASIRKSKNKRS